MRPKRVSAALLTAALLVFFGGATPQDAWAAPVPPPPQTSASIEPLSGYEPETVCDPTNKPGAILLANLLTRTYAGTTASISRPCASGSSEHYDGRAIDWMTTMRTPTGLDRGNTLVGWMLATDAAGNTNANARRLGVMYIIWNDKIWAAYRPADGWRPYSTCASYPEVAWDTTCHRDHVHTSLSTLGATGTTSFWVGHVTLVAYQLAYTSTLYQLVSGAPVALTYAQWHDAGFPTPRASPTEYVKYAWTPTLYAVTHWPAWAQQDILTYALWQRAGFPTPHNVAWVAGSYVYKSANDPAVFVRGPDRVVHHLTYAEWVAMGMPSPAII